MSAKARKPLTVKYHRFNESVLQPKYQTKGCAGFDLASTDEHVFNPGSFQLVNTGLVVVTPPGYFLMLSPRSSLFKRKGLILVNSPGIVDQDYSGPDDEIKLALYNPTGSTGVIQAGERIAQGIFVPYLRGDLEEVSEIEGSSRGGFGSTG